MTGRINYNDYKNVKYPSYDFRIVDQKILDSLPNLHKLQKPIVTVEELYEAMGDWKTPLTVEQANTIYPRLQQNTNGDKSPAWELIRDWKILDEGIEKSCVGASKLGALAGYWSAHSKNEFKTSKTPQKPSPKQFEEALRGMKVEYNIDAQTKMQWGKRQP